MTSGNEKQADKENGDPQDDIMRLGFAYGRARDESYKQFAASMRAMLQQAIARRDYLKSYMAASKDKVVTPNKLGVTVHDMHYIGCLDGLRKEAAAVGIEVTVRPVDAPAGAVDMDPELRIEFQYQL